MELLLKREHKLELLKLDELDEVLNEVLEHELLKPLDGLELLKLEELDERRKLEELVELELLKLLDEL